MLKSGVYLGQRYEIISRIGSGGMADVYKAMDHKLNRYVAIKVLKREFREDSKFVSKFRVEAQSAAGLAHPNIVNVYDVGEEQGIPYMVMELVEGITLKDYIEKRGQLTAKEAISIAIQVSNGIEAAHKNHIVHRDIKPQNIIISREGKVKVTDFGIARAASSNTISSNAMGSVHYTSPEQARGGYSDAKSDIYSLGITMYEMLAGRVPFDGDSTVTIAIKHIQEEMVPPSHYAPDIPHSLEQIILKCCQKSPDRRYANMGELIGDLKLSLVDPNGNFVKIPSAAGTETTLFDPEEMKQVRAAADDTDDFENDDDGYGRDSGYRRGSSYRDDDNFDDDQYDEDGNDKDINPGMRRVTKILMIVAAVIIACLIIFFAGKAAGLFKFSSGGISTASSSDSQVEVPNFVGMTFDEAQTKANSVGLGVKNAGTEESEKYDTGTVTKQDKTAGSKVDKNTTINLTVSSGLKGTTVSVPDVTGKTQEEAEKTLEAAGFKVSSEFSEDDANVNKVISQSPSGGSSAGSGATVTITVGVESNNATVPDLSNLSESDAKSKLKSLNLSVGTVTEEYSTTVSAGYVVSQGTAAGSSVAKGTAVSFVVSKGDLPLDQQKWQCNASITLPSDCDTTKPVTIVLEQEGDSTTIVSNTVVSNPYILQVQGKPGASSGIVKFTYTNTSGSSETGTATVQFTRVQ